MSLFWQDMLNKEEPAIRSKHTMHLQQAIFRMDDRAEEQGRNDSIETLVSKGQPLYIALDSTTEGQIWQGWKNL